MAKNIILALLILILIAIIFILLINNESVNLYFDGENVSATCKVPLTSNVNTDELNKEIMNYTLFFMNDTSSNTSSLKKGIEEIYEKHDLNTPKVSVDSIIGKNQVPLIYTVEGNSMLPTLKNGQKVLMKKTHDINVDDIVVANSDEYGLIIKRVSEINGTSIHLESDNKEINYSYEDDNVYESKGINTWVDIKDINGKVIKY